jgi:hypothetical protein
MFLKRASKSLLLLAFATVFLSNCKKGQDDPTISLRTRKARLVGEWNFQSGNASFTYNEAKKAPYNEYFALTSTDLLLTTTYSGGQPVVYTGSYKLHITFTKDGNCQLDEVFASNVARLTGTWNFVSGIGKSKNKESIVIDLDQAANGSPYTGLFCKSRMQIIYDLQELRNRRLVLKAEDKLYANSDGNYTSHSSQYIFTQ